MGTNATQKAIKSMELELKNLRSSYNHEQKEENPNFVRNEWLRLSARLQRGF